MRLGGHDVLIKKGTKAYEIFGKELIRRRFRHRYEINPEYVSLLEEKGLIFSGKAKTEDIVQVLELPSHPFFLGSQFHPELTSTIEVPSPLFFHFVRAALDYSQKTIR